MKLRTIMPALLATLGMLLGGCQPRTASTAAQPYRETEYEYVLAVVLDMSGSFEPYMQADDASAYRFFQRVTEKYFRQRMGSDDRILLTQLSSGDRPLLWDGQPGGLKRRFPDSKAFADFLKTTSPGNGSNVYASVADTLNYLTRRPGITENTTVLTVVLSDLLDNDPNADAAKAELQDALRRYHDRNGYIGFYWVDQTKVQEWDQLLDDAGYPSRVWMDIVDDPELPDFEY